MPKPSHTERLGSGWYVTLFRSGAVSLRVAGIVVQLSAEQGSRLRDLLRNHPAPTSALEEIQGDRP